MFKIGTWNVNSLRVRLPHVFSLLQTIQPDVFALQETKLVDEHFPITEIQQMGYTVIFSGQKTYNGVALISKKKISDVTIEIPELDDPQRRFIGATIDGIRILNFYMPNGESVSSTKYQYKLNWLQKVNTFIQQELLKYPKLIILGDFNIAPHAMDVHDPRLWEGKVLFSEAERQAFQHILQIGLTDCFRLLNGESKEFSWWDYRMNGFKRNLGLRIDHILASPPLSSICLKCFIDKTPRAWERPSDHAPVFAEFNC